MKIEPISGGQNFELTLDGGSTPDTLVLLESLGRFQLKHATDRSGVEPEVSLIVDSLMNHIPGPFNLSRAALYDIQNALELYRSQYRTDARKLHRGRFSKHEATYVERFQRHNLATTAFEGICRMFDDIDQRGSTAHVVCVSTTDAEASITDEEARQLLG